MTGIRGGGESAFWWGDARVEVDLNSWTGVCERHYGNRRQHVLDQCHGLLKLLHLLSPGFDTNGILEVDQNYVVSYILTSWWTPFLFATPELTHSNFEYKKRGSGTRSLWIPVSVWCYSPLFCWIVHSENNHGVNQQGTSPQTHQKTKLWVTLTNELFCLRWWASLKRCRVRSVFIHLFVSPSFPCYSSFFFFLLVRVHATSCVSAL